MRGGGGGGGGGGNGGGGRGGNANNLVCPVWLPWLSVVMVLVALLVAGLGFSMGSARGAMPWVMPAPTAPPGVDVNQILRTNSEIFGSALQDEKRRADHAVSEKATSAAALTSCQRDLAARDQYISGPVTSEMRKLRDELAEAKEALLRVEAYFGAAAMQEAQRHRGWLRRALAMGADGYGGARVVVSNAREVGAP